MCAIIAPYFDEAILIQGISHILMRNYFVFALGYAKAKVISCLFACKRNTKIHGKKALSLP